MIMQILLEKAWMHPGILSKEAAPRERSNPANLVSLGSIMSACALPLQLTTLRSVAHRIDDEVKSRNEAGILGGTDNDGTTVSCRRDSFDEAIEELPGIRELSSDGIDVADIFSDDDE